MEIHDAVLIAAAFSMYNCYVDGLATRTPADPQAYDQMGQQMASQAGDVFFVPAGVVHNGRNTGSVKTTLIGTYVVESGKPLSAPAK